MCLIFAACSSDSVGNETEATQVPVTVRVNDFTVSQEEFPLTRGTSLTSYNNVKTLTLAFYKSDGTEQYKVTQMKESMPEGATFGEFSTTLPLGSYTMVVLGYVLYDDDELTLTSPTQAEYTAGKPRETFAATQTVNVSNGTAMNLSATLDRIVTKLQVVSTDGKTADVSNVRLTFTAGSKAFNPTTGLATSNAGSVSTVGNSSAVGATSSSIGYVFLATDEQTMNIIIETLDAEGNILYSKTVNNVPFKRNRVTKLTGAMYDVNASTTAGAFQVNSEWLSEQEMSF